LFLLCRTTTLTFHFHPFFPQLLEIRVNKGARKNLGRPKTSPKENKSQFMNFLQN
jgi:hypothetical protein